MSLSSKLETRKGYSNAYYQVVSKTLIIIIIIFTFKALLYASSYLAIISLSHGSLTGYGEAKVFLKSHSNSLQDSPFVSSTVSYMPIDAHIHLNPQSGKSNAWVSSLTLTWFTSSHPFLATLPQKDSKKADTYCSEDHFHNLKLSASQSLAGVPLHRYNVGTGPRDGVVDSQVTAVYKKSE